MSEKAKGVALEWSVSQAPTHWRQLNLWPQRSLKWVDYLTGADNNPSVSAASKPTNWKWRKEHKKEWGMKKCFREKEEEEEEEFRKYFVTECHSNVIVLYKCQEVIFVLFWYFGCFPWDRRGVGFISEIPPYHVSWRVGGWLTACLSQSGECLPLTLHLTLFLSCFCRISFYFLLGFFDWI